MLNQCPHCLQTIQLSAAQRQKIEEAFARLEPGGALKVGCPLCKQPIQLKKGAGLGPATKSAAQGNEDSIMPPLADEGWQGNGGGTDMPTPPQAPDTNWLASGKFDEKEEVKDVPKALLLIPEGQTKTSVSSAFVELFYQVMQARSAEDAIEEMRYIDFAAIVMHTRFETGDLRNSIFHQYMCRLGMAKRRNIYYILVGPELHTLYNLEALAFSANLVVNDNDSRYMKTIIRKGLRDNEELFAPFLQALKALGKK